VLVGQLRCRLGAEAARQRRTSVGQSRRRAGCTASGSGASAREAAWKPTRSQAADDGAEASGARADDVSGVGQQFKVAAAKTVRSGGVGDFWACGEKLVLWYKTACSLVRPICSSVNRRTYRTYIHRFSLLLSV
jgi:hypothetical protein